jgi:hypothetical protein
MKFLDKWEKKKLDMYDIGLTKLSVIAFVLFILSIWPDAANWFLSVNPIYYVAIIVIISARPIYNFFK